MNATAVRRIGAALGGLLLPDRATSAGFVAIGIMHIVAVAMSIAALRRTKTGLGEIRTESSGKRRLWLRRTGRSALA
ncbi:MAG: hypothetical protein M3487_04295, partial [Actinomycetota bacterium]|nr:hypothetical protein [Actinomycetota bacterium]